MLNYSKESWHNHKTKPPISVVSGFLIDPLLFVHLACKVLKAWLMPFIAHISVATGYHLPGDHKTEKKH